MKTKTKKQFDDSGNSDFELAIQQDLEHQDEKDEMNYDENYDYDEVDYDEIDYED